MHRKKNKWPKKRESVNLYRIKRLQINPILYLLKRKDEWSIQKVLKAENNPQKNRANTYSHSYQKFLKYLSFPFKRHRKPIKMEYFQNTKLTARHLFTELFTGLLNSSFEGQLSFRKLRYERSSASDLFTSVVKTAPFLLYLTNYIPTISIGIRLMRFGFFAINFSQSFNPLKGINTGDTITLVPTLYNFYVFGYINRLFNPTLYRKRYPATTIYRSPKHGKRFKNCRFNDFVFVTPLKPLEPLYFKLMARAGIRTTYFKWITTI